LMVGVIVAVDVAAMMVTLGGGRVLSCSTVDCTHAVRINNAINENRCFIDWGQSI